MGEKFGRQSPANVETMCVLYRHLQGPHGFVVTC